MYLALAGKVLYFAVCRKVELTVDVTKPHATDEGLHKNVELGFCSVKKSNKP